MVASRASGVSGEVKVEKSNIEGMMMIRVGWEADVFALQTLLVACVVGMRQADIDQWDDVYPTAQIIADDLKAGTLFVAERAGDVIGAVTLNQKQEPEYGCVAWKFTDEPIGVIHRLMITPSLQRQGLGRTLMAGIEEQAALAGCRSIRLDTFSGNPPALRLYREMGYTEVGSVHFRKGLFLCFEKPLARVTQVRG
jgi:GNAT superfamily N-acetyltransferase